MTPRDSAEKQFQEDIDRLLNGEQPEERQGDPDYADTVLFARRLMQLREEPAPEFAGSLRRRLLTEMAARDEGARESESWFTRMFARPGLRLAVVSTFVVLAAVGLVWRAGLIPFYGTSAPDAESGMLMVPPSPAMSEPVVPQAPRAADDAPKDATDRPTAAAGAPALGGDSLTIAAYSASSVAFGEAVNISVLFSNHGPSGFQLSPFPPLIVIRETATGRVVYTFAAGDGSYALSPQESARYDVVWDQRDGSGAQVGPGLYEVDVDMVAAVLQEGDMTASAGVQNATAFNILSSAAATVDIDDTIGE